MVAEERIAALEERVAALEGRTGVASSAPRAWSMPEVRPPRFERPAPVSGDPAPARQLAPLGDLPTWPRREPRATKPQRDLEDFLGKIYNVKIRRSIILDSYSYSTHSQGLYADGVHGLLLEGNVFDHNGWGNGAAG